MNVYVASRASVPERSAMWRRLRAEGLAITSTWIDEAGEGQTDDFGKLWWRIGLEIAAADALIFYAEAADLPLKGALVEVGMALALFKRVLVVLNDIRLEPHSLRPVGSWLHHPNVTVCYSLGEAVDFAEGRGVL